MSVRATVRNGRLIDEAEREALDSAISRSLSQSRDGHTAPAEAILEKLRARRSG